MTNQERFEALYNEAETNLADEMGFEHLKMNYRERRLEFCWDKLHHRQIAMLLDICDRHGALLSISANADNPSLISVTMTSIPNCLLSDQPDLNPLAKRK